MTSLIPLGDSAFLARFETDEAAAGWAESVRSRNEPCVIDVVAAYSNVAVYVDPDSVDFERVDIALREIEITPAEWGRIRTHRIPAVYDGIDLAEVAARLGLTADQVVEAHSGQEYRVSAIGFLPGFPYASDLPDRLRGLPRRSSPRPRVAAGSVAIAGKQTAIYPSESPGGWHLIGRTPLRIVDVPSGIFPIRVGDRLRFEPIDRESFESRRGLLR